jgi:hypothetical protein
MSELSARSRDLGPGIASLGLAASGFVLALLPAALPLPWLLLLPGLIVALAGVTHSGLCRLLSVAALALSGAGWVIALIGMSHLYLEGR